MTKTRLMKDGEPDDNNISLFVDPDDSASQIPTSRVSRNSECSSVIIKAAKKLKRLNLQQKEMALNMWK